MAVAWQMWQTCGRRVADVVKHRSRRGRPRERIPRLFLLNRFYVCHIIYDVCHTSATRLPHLPRSRHTTAASLPCISHMVPRAFVAYAAAAEIMDEDASVIRISASRDVRKVAAVNHMQQKNTPSNLKATVDEDITTTSQHPRTQHIDIVHPRAKKYSHPASPIQCWRGAEMLLGCLRQLWLQHWKGGGGREDFFARGWPLRPLSHLVLE